DQTAGLAMDARNLEVNDHGFASDGEGSKGSLGSTTSVYCRRAASRATQRFFRQGSNAGHSSGVAQGQRSLNRCSGRDFQHEVFAPTATAAFHSQTVAAGMLLQQRPTRQVLSCATAKLLRDEAESMVPNIDPEQVRKLAGWGLTQNDRASFVGWSQSLISLGLSSFYDLKASGD